MKATSPEALGRLFRQRVGFFLSGGGRDPQTWRSLLKSRAGQGPRGKRPGMGWRGPNLKPNPESLRSPNWTGEPGRAFQSRAGPRRGERVEAPSVPPPPPPLPARPPGACGLAASRLACRACLRAVRPGGLSASAHAGYLEPSIGVNLVREAVKCFPGGPGQALPRESCTLLIILSTSSIQTNSGNTRLLIAGIRFSDIVHFLCGGRAFGRPK